MKKYTVETVVLKVCAGMLFLLVGMGFINVLAGA